VKTENSGVFTRLFVSGGNSTCLPLEDRTQEQRKEMEQQDKRWLGYFYVDYLNNFIV
jgi:hypothetical protein